MTQEDYKEYNNLVTTTLNELELSKKQREMLGKLFTNLAETIGNGNSGNECTCKPKVEIDVSEFIKDESIDYIVITEREVDAIKEFNAIFIERNDVHVKYYTANYVDIDLPDNVIYVSNFHIEYINNEYRLYIGRPA